jgi:hypothetical protein
LPQLFHDSLCRLGMQASIPAIADSSFHVHVS